MRGGCSTGRAEPPWGAGKQGHGPSAGALAGSNGATPQQSSHHHWWFSTAQGGGLRWAERGLSPEVLL